MKTKFILFLAILMFSVNITAQRNTVRGQLRITKVKPIVSTSNVLTVDSNKRVKKVSIADLAALLPAPPAAPVATGLERLTELPGRYGYRLIGKNPSNYSVIGEESVDLSHSSTFSSSNGAKGRWSIAAGYESRTQGEAGVAMGYRTNAAGGGGNVALGWNTMAYQPNNGKGAFAGGYGTSAIGSGATAFGLSQTVATGDGSFAAGYFNKANSKYSSSFGRGNSSNGDNSTTFGRNNNAQSYGEFSIGIYSTDYVATSTAVSSPTDRIFNVGNGTSNAARKDAFTIYKNGAAVLHPISKLSITNPTAGMFIIDSDELNKLKFYDGTNWQEVSFILD